MNAQEKEHKLIWAINTARVMDDDRPLKWAEKVGAVRGSNARQRAFALAMAGYYGDALKELE